MQGSSALASNTERLKNCAFVDAAFGDAGLRLDCADHGETTAEEGARIWARFAAVA